MRIACVGGGPAGLSFAIFARQLGMGHEITVYERAPVGSTKGWGVVFWDTLLAPLEQRDASLAHDIGGKAFRWRDQMIHVQGRSAARLPGHGYGIARQTLLEVLTRRARDLGVELKYGHEVRRIGDLGGADLVVASDGATSLMRDQRADTFGTTIHRGRNKYIWLGTSKVFESFTFPFVTTDAGWIWAHAYAFDDRTSTFIVETTPETWAGLGFERLDPTETVRALERLFAAHLDGHALRQAARTVESATWSHFQSVTNVRWHHGPLVLMGDAAHTTHFTIGAGTRLAIEDAIELTDALAEHTSLPLALERYGRRRAQALAVHQSRATLSARWFENLPRYIDSSQFEDLLSARRSSALHLMGPKVYLRLAKSPTVWNMARQARKVIDNPRVSAYLRRH